MAEQIQKLADLRAAGVLSDDEFASAKARLIAQ
ncbi:SHOCT domain-containing protein [Curtobacterium albidum]|uniref:SHOCT domain-containing protein n=1 Tax=Curtobacterium citreum TaxID=2036 RepID=A0A850DYU3_9MICO|nr:SHOCT domain-containing protein [Curtobacterium albidum]